MKPCYEPGKFANWIAPPNKGIEGRPVEHQYVRMQD
jgi:benzoyl-CoA 2,3-dioxygenase component B